MKFLKTLDQSEPVSAMCPICGVVVPLLFIRFEQQHWWKRRVKVTVDGDATDWVAHLWQHGQQHRARM
jgi:hypothetical protein